MKKLNLFSNLWSLLVGSRKDEGRTRLRVVIDSFTCRLRVSPHLRCIFAALFLLLGVGIARGATTVTFTFNTDAGLSALGITKPGSGKGTELTANSPYTLTPVSMSVTHGGSTNTRVWNSSGNTTLRTYNSSSKHATITFSVSSSYYLTQVAFSGGTSWNANNGTYSSGTWTKADKAEPTSVTFTSSNGNTITTIAVTYETATPADPYTVSFSTGTGNPTQADITEASAGAGITLPVGPTPACSSDGWSFAGWKETSAQSSASAPSSKLWQAGETYSPAANTTLYAVYFKASGNYYQYIDNINSLFDGAKMIITAYNSEESTEYAVSNTMDGDGYIYSSSVSPDGDDVISSPANSIVWTLKGYKDNWTLKNVGNNKYIIVSTRPALADVAETVSITYEIDEDDYDQFNIQKGSKYLTIWNDNTLSGYDEKTYLYFYQQQGIYNSNPSCAACDADPTIGDASINGSFNMTSTTSAIGVASGTCSTGNAACDWTDYGFVWSDGANTTTPTVGGTNCNKVKVGESGTGTSWTGSITPSGSTTPTSWTTGHTYYVRTYGKNSKTGAEFVHGTAFSFTPRSITFNSNGGSAVSTIYVNSGTAASAPTAPTRSHYTFGGWYTASDLKTAVDWSSTISEDKTYYAKWTEDPYKTVVFKSSGVVKQSGKVYVGERPTAPTLIDGTSNDACDATSDKHYGWTTSTWSGSIATQATLEEDYTVYAKGANLPVVAAGDPATITYNAVWAESVGVPSDEYQLVTNISQLSAGDKIVIANAGSSSTYLMSKDTVTEAGYQFRRVAQCGTFSISSSKITISTIASSSTDRTNPHVFTVGKSGDYWTFYDPLNSAYISCASDGDSKNGLGYENSLSDAGKWDISISGDNKATILSQIGTSTRNRLQANGNPFSIASSFTCSKNTMTDPYIFRNLATLGYQNYMTTCCDKTIAIDNPSITDAASSGATITFDQASPVATCEGNKEVVATLTLPAGYQATSLSFSVSSGTVSVSPAISTPISSTTAYTLTFSQDQNATLTTTATIAAKSLSSITLAESSVTIYDQQYALIGVTYDPADILTKGYTLTGPALTKLVTTGSTQTQLKISATKAGVTINEEVSETVSIKANADATKTASVSVTIKPLPRVHFADIVHGNAFADVVATIEENALVKDQPTPTPQDIAAPGSSNTCENTHLHLIGWIDSEWSGVVNYLNNTAAAPETSAIIGATGYYYPAGTDIDTDSKNGKTYYAVWAVEE